MNTTNKTKEEFAMELKKRFPNNDIEILEFSGASKRIKYKCNVCERIYEKSRANHLYENKTLCQKCYSARNSEIKNKFLNTIEKNDDLELISKSLCTSQKVKIKCKKCNRDFEVKMDNFLISPKCTYCKKSPVMVDKTEMERRMAENDKIDYEILEYNNFTSSATFKHTKCGFIYTQLPYNFLLGKGCPKCSKHISVGEQKIMKYLTEHNIKFVFQKKYEELNKQAFDFFLPEYNILIEYQGEQHYIPIKYFGGEEKLFKQQERDNKKRNFCLEKNIKLIEIPYYDQNNLDKYLNHLKGSTTIYVDSSESKED